MNGNHNETEKENVKTIVGTIQINSERERERIK
jgi:hypothetical protein